MSNFKQKYANHIWNVFASTVFLTYTWSICILMWDMPALLLKYKTQDIVGYISYQLTFAFIESILITLFVIGLSFLLPAKYLRNNLSVSGSILVLSIGTVTASYRALSFIAQKVFTSFPGLETTFVYQLVGGLWLFVVILLQLIMIKAGKSESVARFTLKFLERLSTLAGLYIFMSIFSLLIVIFRNIK